jgi:hypothetical protein
MGDSFFDARRATGDYPPKGWGWQSHEYQRNEIIRRLKLDNQPEWVFWEAFAFRLIDKAGLIERNDEGAQEIIRKHKKYFSELIAQKEAPQ